MRDLWAEARKKGAIAVGRGYKFVRGEKTPDESIIFGVPKKRDVSLAMTFNAFYAGVPSDVIETGIIKAFDNTERMRPARPGCSIGHHAISAGTFGCLVYKNGERFILSNNHVLANSNNAAVGDRILQPGPHDGGNVDSDTIAELFKFVPIHFDGEPSQCPVSKAIVWLQNKMYSMIRRKTAFPAPIVPYADFNLVDAAIAMPISDGMVADKVIDIGSIIGTKAGYLGMPIQKSGRTTGHTVGEITTVDVTVQVQYDAGRIAVFTDQLMAGAMSAGGDSGSAVIDLYNYLVGLLFAGSETTTIINRWENVEKELGVNFAQVF